MAWDLFFFTYDKTYFVAPQIRYTRKCTCHITPLAKTFPVTSREKNRTKFTVTKPLLPKDGCEVVCCNFEPAVPPWIPGWRTKKGRDLCNDNNKRLLTAILISVNGAEWRRLPGYELALRTRILRDEVSHPNVPNGGLRNFPSETFTPTKSTSALPATLENIWQEQNNVFVELKFEGLKKYLITFIYLEICLTNRIWHLLHWKQSQTPKSQHANRYLNSAHDMVRSLHSSRGKKGGFSSSSASSCYQTFVGCRLMWSAQLELNIAAFSVRNCVHLPFFRDSQNWNLVCEAVEWGLGKHLLMKIRFF